MIVPPAPTAITFEPELPQTPFRSEVLGFSICAHEVPPAKWKIVPPPPTAKASVAELPHSPCIADPSPVLPSCGAGGGKGPQPEPVLRMKVTLSVAAQTSAAEAPHTARTGVASPLACDVQPPPSLWSMVPAFPAA